jgi:hypothetical protein
MDCDIELVILSLSKYDKLNMTRKLPLGQQHPTSRRLFLKFVATKTHMADQHLVEQKSPEEKDF